MEGKVKVSLCGLALMLAGLLLLPALEGRAKKPTSGKNKPIIITVNNGALEDEAQRLKEQRLIEQTFAKRYPQAQLEFSTWQFGPETFVAKMIGGTATDVIGIWASFGTNVLERGYALDITDMVKKWELYPDIIPETIESMIREGRVFGIPAGGLGGGYVMTLFYNTKLFREAGIVDEQGNAKPPETWEEFVEVAVKLTDREKGRAGFGILGDPAGAGWHFLNWVWQAGGEFEQKREGKWVAVFDSPEAVRALQFIRDLRWKHKVLQDNVLADNDAIFELYTTERVAMAFFAPEYLYYIVEKLEFPLEKIGIALLPAGPAGRVNQMGGSYYIINPTIPKEKWEWAFKAITIHFDLELIEQRCQLMRKQGRLVGIPYLPVFAGEYQDKIDAVIDKYRNVPKYERVLSEAVRYVRPEPPYYSQELYRQFLGPAVQAVLTSEKADAQKLLHDYNRQFQRRFLDRLNLELGRRKK